MHKKTTLNAVTLLALASIFFICTLTILGPYIHIPLVSAMTAGAIAAQLCSKKEQSNVRKQIINVSHRIAGALLGTATLCLVLGSVQFLTTR